MMGMSFVEVVKKIRDVSACSRCGKATLIMNVNALVGQRGDRPEFVSPATHCDCGPIGELPAGPAYHGEAA